ncbi:MAG: MmgE/PrpD family protein [Alcaligenaceae bacterium]
MNIATSTNSSRAGHFVAGMTTRSLSAHPEVLDTAKKCLADWISVALGARQEPAAQAIHRVVNTWHTQGSSRLLLGGTCAPIGAALANGTLAHCLDFDDTHSSSVAHLSGPTWAAVLALGMDLRSSEHEMLAAFIAGFEVGAQLGAGGFGIVVSHYGWHSTGVFGCLAAAAASASLLKLEASAVERALGAAATQTGGLTASFGTMAKPFHAGKAALNGLLAAQMAQADFSGSTLLLEQNAGLGQALVREQATMPKVFETDRWELLRNGFKPYACCLLTHAAVDSARTLRDKLQGKNIVSIEARVHPLTIKLAGKTELTSPLEGKFSTAFVIALGLSGYTASRDDFSLERLRDPTLLSLASKVTLVPDTGLAETAASLLVTCSDGSIIAEQTLIAKGNPDNPMTWTDMYEKFKPLVEPTLGSQTLELFEILKNFEQPNQLNKLEKILATIQPLT